VTGARPIAVSDCLNFGSPEDPSVMWQFSEAVRGIADACQQLGTPVTGGNVSFYNQTGQTPIHPTPVVGVLGLIDDVTKRTRMGFKADGDRLVLLGDTREELDCSEWAWVVHQHLGGRPPAVDLAAEQALGEVLIAVSEQGLATSAHDLSEGGLAIALVESALRHGAGARVDVPAGVSPFVWLLSESAHRALLSVAPGQIEALRSLAAAHGVPFADIGEVRAGSGELVIEDQFHVSLDELATAHRGTLPKLFG
jgi:phosphoribosylformylglycinamidine synthase